MTLEDKIEPDAPTGQLLAEIARLEAELRRRRVANAQTEALNQAILESSTDYAIISLDLEGRVTSWNAGAQRIFGWSEAEALGRSAEMIFTPEEIAEAAPQREMQRALASGRSSDDRYQRRKDGSRFFASGTMMPLHLEGGPPFGFLKILRDRTLTHQAAESLKADEARLRLEQAMLQAIFRHAPIGLSLAEGPSGRSLMMSDEVMRMTGRDLQGPDLGRYEHGGAYDLEGRRLAPEEYPIARALRAGETVRRQLLVLEHVDGGRIRAEVSSSPLFGPDGEIAAAVAVIVDVEERERAMERQQLLISELAHRMKNTLAMVQAIVSQTLRAASSLDAARDQIMDRFRALARAQDVLTRTSWDSALIGLVVRSALEPVGHRDHQMTVEGPEVRLGSRAALNFTLALHELATNAVKYGALSTPEGRVQIDWRIEATEAGEALVFTWNESGGPTVSPPRRKGFGSRLLEGLSRTFDARSELIYAPTGVCWRVHADIATLQQV